MALPMTAELTYAELMTMLAIGFGPDALVNSDVVADLERRGLVERRPNGWETTAFGHDATIRACSHAVWNPDA